MQPMVLAVSKPTTLADLFRVFMLVCIFKHHGAKLGTFFVFFTNYLGITDGI
jgi:hypothetical protein